MNPTRRDLTVDPNDDRADVVIGTVVFVVTLATIALALRIYTRKFLIKQFGLDDYAAIFSWVRFHLGEGR